jgi:hypothetical protein
MYDGRSVRRMGSTLFPPMGPTLFTDALPMNDFELLVPRQDFRRLQIRLREDGATRTGRGRGDLHKQVLTPCKSRQTERHPAAAGLVLLDTVDLIGHFEERVEPRASRKDQRPHGRGCGATDEGVARTSDHAVPNSEQSHSPGGTLR